MAVAFKVPSPPKRSIDTIDVLRGCDFTNSPANVDPSRSPNCVNMIRDVPGKVRKSLGWFVVNTYDDAPINGCYHITGKNEYIVHCGTKLYIGTTEIYSSMNNARSRAWQFDDRLYIIDGANYLVFYQENGENHVEPVSSSAYIPTVTISKDPDGGGTSYEDLNLLQSGFTEQFLGKANIKDYQLSFKPLDATTVTAKILNSSGEWIDKVEGTDFTVNRTTGVITFGTAPGVSPLTGEDNVKITAYRTVDGYADRINKCTFGVLYGMKGGKDRLFVSGNSDYRNYDWHSEPYKPTYFPDTSYSRLGSDSSSIIGYSVIANHLAAHKDELEPEQNIFLRAGQVGKDDAEIFTITNTLRGIGAIAKDSFGYLETEPLFLTRQGIFAVTAQDITGEKYSQNRSFYLNGKLLNEANLENAYACVFNDNYWLCLNNVAYILDGLQPTVTDKAAPYSTRQYAGFYRTNVPANVMWVFQNELYFGTTDGKVCKFHTDKYALTSYNDNGEPIEAIWETPDIDGELFYKNKSLRYLAIRVDAAVKTSLAVWAMDRGVWNFIKEDDSFSSYLSFNQLSFSAFTFSCDRTQKISRTKMRIKKVDKFRLRFINNKLNEPFTIYNIAFEYIENGYYKG